VRVRVERELAGLLQDPLDCGGFGVEGWHGDGARWGVVVEGRGCASGAVRR
jgi:hypothetical protein